MTPEQKIKHMVLLRDAEMTGEPLPETINADDIDDIYRTAGEEWQLQDAEQEVRGGEVETGLPCESSRYYESKAVAAQYIDGSWVGWTYWYGGGKHSDPGSIDWMDEAYDLDVTEKEKMVTVRTFAKREQAA